jgi:hypothetical protein
MAVTVVMTCVKSCLAHSSAGDPSHELCAGGADVVVDSSNLVAYIQAVVDASLGAGIEAQMAAFREGFNEVRHSSSGAKRFVALVQYSGSLPFVCTLHYLQDNCSSWAACLAKAEAASGA